MDKTFISYSRRDLKFAQRLLNALHNRGINPWFDIEDLTPGVEWNTEMLSGVQFADNILFIISPDSVSSNPCNQELECALRHNKRLIPVLYRDSPMGEIHPALKELQWVFLRSQDDFEAGLSKLIAVLDAPDGINLLSSRVSAEVLVIDAEGERTIKLQRDSYIIGRKPTGGSESGVIIIYDKTRSVSRNHLKLSFQSGYWAARDASRNGIKFFPSCPGGKLRDGVKIFLGESACLIFKEIPFKKLPELEPDERDTLVN